MMPIDRIRLHIAISPDAPQQKWEMEYARSFIAFSDRLDHPDSKSDG